MGVVCSTPIHLGLVAISDGVCTGSVIAGRDAGLVLSEATRTVINRRGD